MRILFLIHTHNPQRPILDLLAAFHRVYHHDPDVEFLLIDDASSENVGDRVRTFIEANAWSRFHVIRNHRHQGLGGNQKVGFRYAIRENFDVVVPIFGNQDVSVSATKRLLDAFVVSVDTDAVVGRLLSRECRSWTSPRHRFHHWLSDLLAMLHNSLTGADLAQWHSPYKAYRTRALKQVAFELNTNEPHFDMEVLLQLLDKERRIMEVALPCRQDVDLPDVRRIKSVRDVLKSSLKYRLQRYNLFYDVRFHPDIVFSAWQEGRCDPPLYSEKFDVWSPHSFICRHPTLIPPLANVLDIGCSLGYVARQLTIEKKCRVTGVDQLPKSRLHDRPFEYHQLDIESEFNRLKEMMEQTPFDVILMLDVLEHLAVPERFLLQLHRVRYPKPPIFIFSTGNVSFFVVRLMLMLGYFNYGRKGILDITHKRLFSVRTFKNLFDQTGFIILDRLGFPAPYRALGFPPGLCRTLESLNRALLKLRPSLFAYQTMIIAAPLESPERVLSKSLANSPAALSP